MKKIHFVLLLSGVLFFASCENQNQQSPMPVPTLPVVEVPAKTVTGYSSYPASLEGTVTSAVRAKVSGYITDVLVDEGAKVRKGQQLFKLETQTLSQDAEAAVANVNAARVEVDRLKPLVERGIVSQVQLQTAEARLAQAEAAYNSISASIDYAVIKSPVDGYVGSINFRQGALVSPADPTPLTTVADVDEVYAFFAMNERDYLDFIQKTPGESLNEKIENFPPVQLQLVNDSIYQHDGQIQTVSGQINPTTGTVQFRAVFPNPNRILASGNSGRIQIPRTYENVPVVPESTTFERQGRVYVYKVHGDTLAVATTIGIRDRIQNLVVIESGIKAGDKIVAQGIGKLRDKSPINPQPMPFDSIASPLNVVFK